ncbi:MAG: GNAT family N-acetyltransferase [Selenomonas sp.]|nr:GNAT family N-acetyltransferase [Selenomonas sp.]
MLLDWRMEVLSHVFAKERQDMTETDWNGLREENRCYYEQELPRGGHIACLAMVDGQLAGCGGVCLYREMPSPDNHTGKCGYLMNIYTREEFRHQGIAQNVCTWLIQQGKSWGAEKIYLETSECGKGLYHSLGFKDMQDYLKLED